jgi:hypothetical protein
VERFARSLHRRTSLNYLANAARSVLSDPEQMDQVWLVLEDGLASLNWNSYGILTTFMIYFVMSRWRTV